MKTGPKPIPTIVKKLTGYPGRRPLPDNELQPERYKRRPKPPDSLDRVGKNEWVRMSSLMWKTGHLTKLDRAALELYCSAYSIWRDAILQLQENGLVIKAQSGFPIQSPYLPIVNKQQAIMKALLAELWGTPSSRAGAKIEPPKKGDKLEEFLSDSKKIEAVK